MELFKSPQAAKVAADNARTGYRTAKANGDAIGMRVNRVNHDSAMKYLRAHSN